MSRLAESVAGDAALEMEAIPYPVRSHFESTAPDYFPRPSSDAYLKSRVYPHSGQFEHPKNRP